MEGMDRHALMFTTFVSLVMYLVLCAGCTSAPSEVSPIISATNLPAPVTPVQPPESSIDAFSGDWILISMSGQDPNQVITPSTEISLKINSGGTFSGYTGCNNYGGQVLTTGTTSPFGSGILLGPISSSKQYCAPIAEQETMYLSVLQQAIWFSGDRNHLQLRGDTGVLAFKPPALITSTTAVPARY